jgi:hypothetical protein
MVNRWKEREKELMKIYNLHYQNETKILLRVHIIQLKGEFEQCKLWRDEELKQKKEELINWINDNSDNVGSISHYKLTEKLKEVFKDEN